MIGVCLRIALRNLLRNKVYALINLTGLMIAFTCITLLGLYVFHEHSYDNFHANANRIFRVIQIFNLPDGDQHVSRASIHLAEALRSEVPEVENTFSIVGGSPTWVEIEDNRFFEEDHILVSPQFLEVFSYELIEGNSQSLKKPFSIVLTRSLALKFFGRTDVVGEIVNYERYGKFTVTGVLSDPPGNSNLRFNALMSQEFDNYLAQTHPRFPPWFNSWQGSPAATYVLLDKEADHSMLELRLNRLIGKYTGPQTNESRYYLQNIREQHLANVQTYGFNIAPQGNVFYTYIFSGIGIFILVIAAFNYINLASARALSRFKEVGVRKVVGATRRHIALQFITESLLLCLVALPLTLEMTILLIPYLESLAEIEFNLSLENVWAIFRISLVCLIVFGIINGLYPALYVSNFSATDIFNHRARVGGNKVVRNGLIVGQFVLSLIMIITTIVVSRQIDFATTKDLGFNKDHLLVVEVNGAGVRENYSVIRNELLRNPEVLSVAGFTVMVSGAREPESVSLHKSDRPDTEAYSMQFYGMDEGGIETLGLELLAGNNFTGIPFRDSTGVILNETAAGILGGRDIIGEWISITSPNHLQARVLGIVKDFHFRSLFDRIEPLVLGYLNTPIESIDDMVIRISGNEINQTIASIEEIHNRFDENKIMTWTFLDQFVDDFYSRDKVFREVYRIGSGLIILIACLGLVGLSSFMAASRTKEFGIRKVLGSSVSGLIGIQWWQFVRLILLANLISWPIAGYAMSDWLDNYAYRTTLLWTDFLIAGSVVLVIALLTVSYETIKVATTNPVDSLRNE